MPLNRQTWKFLETGILPSTIRENYPFPTPELKTFYTSHFNFHQIRQQPYPLQTDFENVPDSGLGMSRAQLPYSPADFHLIRQQPYPFPTDSENVRDFRFRLVPRVVPAS